MENGTRGAENKFHGRCDEDWPLVFRTDVSFSLQHRCVSIFTDKKTNSPTGFALGSIEGRVAIHYVNPQNPKDNFTFKCHRSNGAPSGVQDIYAVSSFTRLTFLTSFC